MKLKIGLHHYFISYFFLMLALYHYKVKHYFYWNYIAELKDADFAFSLERLFWAILILLINLFFLSKIRRTKFIFIVLSIFFTLLTIPSLIAFTSKNMYSWQLLGFHQLLFFFLYFFSKIRLNFSNFPVLNKKHSLYILLLITVLGAIPYLFVYGPHINLKNLFLIDVYETRSSMNGLSNAYFGYTYSVFTKIVIPLTIVFSFELKNKLTAIFGVLLLLLFYLFGAHKTVLAALIIVFIFYKLSYYGAVKKLITLSNFLIVIVIICALIGYDYPWILTFRRVHFLPTLLDIAYLDFFKDQPLNWSESVLKSFFEYPFDMNHANVIGENYFNRETMAANNGAVSDGYMNFGTVGVVINSFLIAVYFMILNSLKIPARYFGLFVVIIFSFLSSSTLTVFLTHGALALLLISIFLLNEKNG